MTSETIETIKGLMRTLTTAKLVYQKKSGDMVHREVEPYSFSAEGNKLFAYCRRDNEIKQFFVEKIVSVEPGELFAPKVEVRVPGEAPIPPRTRTEEGGSSGTH